jgi:hypothetical protein
MDSLSEIGVMEVYDMNASRAPNKTANPLFLKLHAGVRD